MPTPPSDWKGKRADSSYQEGHVNRARAVGKVSPVARGKTQRVGRTSTTLENGASSVASRVTGSFRPKPR